MKGKINVVIVQNLGGNQIFFKIISPKAKEYLQECIEFYNSCEYVRWNEVTELYKRYQDIEKTRNYIDIEE